MAETAANPNTVLRITDDVTGRRSTMRIDPDDAALPLRDLLDLYLMRPDVERLSNEGRITEPSAEMLASIQDLAYVCDDLGRLRGLYGGVEFAQGPRAVSLDYPLRPALMRADGRDVTLLDLSIDRTSVGYDRNWTGFSKRRWDHRADFYAEFVADAVRRACGEPRAESVLASEDAADRVRLLEALARRIWESDFESYSRFTGHKLAYKWGDETVCNIATGAGGICSEKVQALKFLTDHLGFDSEYVIAGPNVPEPVPEDRLRELLTTFDFRFAKRHMRYWQHTALLFRIDGESVLVDDTNGNIPFLFLRGAEADRLLGIRGQAGGPGQDGHTAGELLLPPRVPGHRVRPAVRDGGVDPLHRPRAGVRQRAGAVHLVRLHGHRGRLSGRARLRKDRGRVPRRPAAGPAGRATCHGAGTSARLSARPLPPRIRRSPNARPGPHANTLLARYDECHGAEHEAGLVVIGLQGTLPDRRS